MGCILPPIVICGAMELRYFWIKESSRSGLLGLCTFSLAEAAEWWRELLAISLVYYI